MWDYCADDPINAVDPLGLQSKGATWYNNPTARIVQEQIKGALGSGAMGGLSGGVQGAVIGGGWGGVRGTVKGVIQEIPPVRKALDTIGAQTKEVKHFMEEWEGGFGD